MRGSGVHERLSAIQLKREPPAAFSWPSPEADVLLAAEFSPPEPKSLLRSIRDRSLLQLPMITGRQPADQRARPVLVGGHPSQASGKTVPA